MNLGLGRLRTTIRLTVVTVFIIATTLTAAVAIGLQYYFGRVMATEAAGDLYATASDSVAAELRSLAAINANIIELLSDNPSLSDRGAEDAHLATFIGVLEKNPLYYGVYIGGGDGRFFEVINLDASKHARRALRALPSDRWLVMTVTPGTGGATRHLRYLDRALATRLSRTEAADYDPRTRDWYRDALESNKTIASAPYLFAQLGIPGRTLSRRVTGSDAVVAIDMTLSSISEFLQEHAIATRGNIYLYNRYGEIITSSLPQPGEGSRLPAPSLSLSTQEKAFIEQLPTLTVSNETDWPPIDFAQSGEPRGYAVDMVRMIADMTGVKIRFVSGSSWSELVDMFRAGKLDILQPVLRTGDNEDFGLFGAPLMRVPLGLVTSDERPVIADLSELDGLSVAIPSGWSILGFVRRQFPGIQVVEADNTLDAINKALSGEVAAALDNEVILRFVGHHYFLNGYRVHTGVSLGEGQVPDELHVVVSEDRAELRGILDKAITAIVASRQQYLENKWFNFETSRQETASDNMPSEVFITIAGDPALHGQLMNADIDGELQLVYGAPITTAEDNALFLGISTPMETVMAPFISKVRLSILITGIFMLLLLPLSWFFANPIVRPVRQLAEQNDRVRRREYDEVVKVPSYVKELDELSDSMVSMVRSIQAHELAERELMDSIIRLIAQAIDDKSAYTGGHCERVPELALMLAKHASDSDLPAFRSFSLADDDEWREYRIAAWLHDCGKITTPEHIVDKGSKLETIYNRIHEVRMRFEVLRRDAEIDYLRAMAESPDRHGELREILEKRQHQLQEDFAFVAECNVGGEYLGEDKLQRLQSIAETTWQRYFDDRIGLSPVEELRLAPEVAGLPAQEKLLADKPEHVIERDHPADYAPELGIDMDIPRHLYNLGEVYNLSISRGTLTEEDRFKINEHMISTIKMLESLPFPPELKNVPRYASTHHETMKGSGYPRRLAGPDLSIPERLLAVADVFEALTASDRPYKKAKPVSVAIDILHQMVLDNHIDKDCFELFIRDRVYEEYARRFLPPDQLDEVDAQRYL